MSSENIGIEQARKTLGDLVTRVQQTGAAITLTRNGKPAARLAPLEPAMTSPTPWSLAYEAEGTTEAAWVLRDPDRDIIEVADNIDEGDIDAAKRWAAAHLAAIGLNVETWAPHHPGPGTQPSHWNAATADEFATADAWADALDTEMKRTGRNAGDLISHGYADGQLLGVPLNPEHENADDERGVVVGDAPDGSTWTVRYNQQTGWWEAA